MDAKALGETTVVGMARLEPGQEAWAEHNMVLGRQEAPQGQPVRVLERRAGRAGLYEYRVRKLAAPALREEVGRELAAKGLIMEDYNVLADAMAHARRTGEGKLALRLMAVVEKTFGMELAGKIDRLCGVRSQWARGA